MNALVRRSRPRRAATAKMAGEGWVVAEPAFAHQDQFETRPRRRGRGAKFGAPICGAADRARAWTVRA